jgi:molecular chaperone HtpG
MARSVPEEIGKPIPVRGTLGAQLLEVVTAGMYSDPRMILREYIQNAVDSLDLAEEKGVIGSTEGIVDIRLEGQARTITIEDNGLGVPLDELSERLGSLGRSEKEGMRCRGFRGIGRLGGLAYCDEIRFETRADRDRKIGIVTWDGVATRELIRETRGRGRLADIVQRVASTYARRPSSADPSRFFRVTLSKVRPFHSDDLMNLHRVRDYLSQVAPVPFDRERFRFADAIDERLNDLPGYRSYEIRVNDRRICRPYSDQIPVNDARTERIQAVEQMDFEGADGRLMGRGWYAITDLCAAFPPSLIARGIRMRQGNIGVGEESFLEHCFTERRFAAWHIGEIHVDTGIRPNARRDGFEHSADYERFLEQARVLGTHLSALCRRSSKNRSMVRTVGARLLELERQVSAMLFPNQTHLESFLTGFDRCLLDLETRMGTLDVDHGLRDRLRRLRRRADDIRRCPRYLSDSLDRRKLRQLEPAELLKRISESILADPANGLASKELLRTILDPYLKPSLRRRLRH